MFLIIPRLFVLHLCVNFNIEFCIIKHIMLNSIAYLIIFFTLMFYIVRLTVFQGIATPMQQEPFLARHN